MTEGFTQIAVFLALLALLTKPLGIYIASVYGGKLRFFAWFERPLYSLFGIREDNQQTWQEYAKSLLVFSAAGCLVTFALLRLQPFLPLTHSSGGMVIDTRQMTPDLAFNTAVSFTTNTNWQNYSPELSLTTLSNMVALAIQNWMSAAVGMGVAIALIRGLSRKEATGIGNFWVDVTRGTIYVLFPISLLAALVFVSQGVPQTFLSGVTATTMEGITQRIGLGPIASQEAIKHLGTNGGGFFNANSAHPLENPNSFTDLFTKLLIFSIPAALTYTFGRMVGNVRQGWSIFSAMAVLFMIGASTILVAEQTGNPAFALYGVETANWEGKEARFGIGASTLFAAVTTSASAGAVNSMHNSFTPLGALVTLFNMQSGEVIFGGVGAGLYGMLVFAILAVFIAGLMVGRTPEYLGKKIDRFEIQMAILTCIVLGGTILGFTALASVLQIPTNGALAALNTWNGSAYGATNNAYGAMANNVNNAGPRGFSEILYAFSSATGNNGSAFAGLTGNTPIYNSLLGVAMLVGRFGVIIPVLAIAGALARKRQTPRTSGTFVTDNGTFVILLIGTVVLIGVLTFLPALALGPVAEQLQMTNQAMGREK